MLYKTELAKIHCMHGWKTALKSLGFLGLKNVKNLTSPLVKFYTGLV